MDWQQRSLQWLQRPQSIALVAGATVMVALIAFQANQFTPKKPPMCELISQCHLRHGDLQRIQVALGESRLDGFEIQGEKLLVPSHRHSEYLQAVTERDALPMDLRDDRSESISNPLLSRSQQQALKWQRKKRQLKEMILRLPFVQQAWLEIDTAPSSSPFQPTRQSAVLSVQPSGDGPLDVYHVDTLRRMMVGAVAGLQANQIEVIDLGEGFAYDRAGTSSGVSATEFAMNSTQHRRAHEQQLEDQIKVALSRFAGVDVKVHLAACRQPVAHAFVSKPASEHQQKAQRDVQVQQLVAGSNGVASIYDEPAEVAGSNRVPALQVSHSQSAPAEEDTVAAPVCRVAVQVEVPESALANVATSLMLRRPEKNNQQPVDRIEQKFGSIRPLIEREVASVLPPAWIQVSGASPVEVTLRRSTDTPVASQSERYTQLFQKYWPSAGALFVGALLLTLVTRKSSFRGQDEMTSPEILSLSQHRKTNSEAAKNAKENINRMFRDDPDGAAAAIEGWIKKAG